MSRNNVRGPTSALTEFLRESNITTNFIQRRARTRQQNETQQAQGQQEAGPSNAADTPADEMEVDESGPSTRRRSRPSRANARDEDSDHLDESEEEKAPAKKRKTTKVAEAKQKAKAKAAAKKKKGDGDEDYEDSEDEDDDVYTALSRNMVANAAASPPKPGSFEECARCEIQFTVTKYTMAANPPPGYLCHKCVKETGADKRPAVAPRKRKAPVDKRNVVHFEEKRFPTLVSLCIQMLSRHINDVEALGDIGHQNIDSIIRALSRNRSLTPENATLFYGLDKENIILYDATKLVPDSLSTLAMMNPNLTRLRLDFCGRMNDEVIHTWSTNFPALTHVELLGPFLVRVPGWLNFIRSHPDLKAFCITQSPRFDIECLKTLADSCAGLEELRLKEVGKLGGGKEKEEKDAWVDELCRFEGLKLLDLSDPSGEGMEEEGLIRLVKTLGEELTCLDLSGHGLISDDFLNEALLPTCRKLTSLSLQNLPLPTDEGMANVFEQWASENANLNLEHLSFLRMVQLGYMALSAIVTHPAAPHLQSLNINGWRNTDSESLEELGKKGLRELRRLDLGWNREVTDMIVGEILEGCGKLEELKVWGCNKLTVNCPTRREVAIMGVESHAAA